MLKLHARQILAINVIYLRLMNGWSQEELAYRANRSVSLISDIENALVSASIDVIEDIGLAFGYSVSYLTNDNGFIVIKKRVDSKNS